MLFPEIGWFRFLRTSKHGNWSWGWNRPVPFHLMTQTKHTLKSDQNVRAVWHSSYPTHTGADMGTPGCGCQVGCDPLWPATDSTTTPFVGKNPSSQSTPLTRFHPLPVPSLYHRKLQQLLRQRVRSHRLGRPHEGGGLWR